MYIAMVFKFNWLKEHVMIYAGDESFIKKKGWGEKKPNI